MTVLLFTRPGCTACEQVKTALEGVEYQEREVIGETVGVELMEILSYHDAAPNTSLPVLVINDVPFILAAMAAR